MNRAIVDPIAEAVLYEGYILYPYRPSVKNRQRWTFGGLYPDAYCRSRGGDASSLQAECLVSGTPATTIEAVVRFLHLTARLVNEVVLPLNDRPEGAGPPTTRPVESLRVGDRLYQTWQEAQEREVAPGAVSLGDLSARPRVTPFAFPGGRRVEPVLDATGLVVGVLVREQQAVEGVVEMEATEAPGGLFRVTIRVANRTPLNDGDPGSRDEVSLRALVSSHAMLGVAGGEFVSLTDPPGSQREAAAACRNVGVWPVLVGEAGRKDTMLASPIILPDYPQVAPESAGNFFDGTEIDEMLTLRIMTLTDAEKGEMAAVDDRAGDLLARVEGMARDRLLGLHGAVRGLRPVPEGGDHG